MSAEDASCLGGKSIHIGKRRVGPGASCYIIAEAGVNHNGDVEMAKRLIVEAKRAGADCIKFQTFKAEQVVTFRAPKAHYQMHTTDPAESQLDMLHKLELRLEHYDQLLVLCTRENIAFLSTPYSIEDIEFLDQLGVAAFKIASAMLVEIDFLQYAARRGKPIILSTGMATLAEVGEAVRRIRECGNDQIVLLQCTTDYPARIEHANLRAMQTMARAFGLPVGYSDHTQTPTACILSIALGACVIEKHFTLDKSLPGPDQSASADPGEFRQIVAAIRDAEAALGSRLKEPSEAEQVNMIGMRRSVVARQAIPLGTTIAYEMLTCKRPATGITPYEMQAVVGAKARVAIEPDQVLEWWMLERPADSQA